MAETFAELAKELVRTVEAAMATLSRVTEGEAVVPYAPGKWSRKEILGHLLDSETNNHQRFVRAQGVAEVTLPAYDQRGWVRAHGYAERPWTELLELWRANNHNLAEVLRRVPESDGEVLCRIGQGEPMSLRALAVDYLEHMRHHLAQLDPKGMSGGGA